MFGKKELNDDNSYEGSGRCRNCGHTQTLRTPLGKTVLDYGHNIKCEMCKTNTWVVTVY